MLIERPLPQPRILSLMPTYRCTAACKSCGTLSSPRSQEKLTLEQVSEAISQAHAAGIQLVVFTGGEATLEHDLLFHGLAMAQEFGMMSRLVTNCHWATTMQASDAYVADLKGAGLGEINFSTGDQHARFVPPIRVLTAVRSALGVGYRVAVMIETTAANLITRATLESDPFHVHTMQLFPDRTVKFNESPWMPLNPQRHQSYASGIAIDASNLHRVRGCDSVLQTVTVQANGSIGACCGIGMRLVPELNIGTLGEVTLTEALNTAEEDLLKRWIRLEGPERILAWAAEKDRSIKWEGQYAHRCQACLRLYRDSAVREVIAKYYMEKAPDILFGEYLLYEYEVQAAPTHADP